VSEHATPPSPTPPSTLADGPLSMPRHRVLTSSPSRLTSLSSSHVGHRRAVRTPPSIPRARTAIHALVRPHHAVPRTASRAPVTSPPWCTRAAPPRARSRRAELGQAVGRACYVGRARPGWATRALRRPAAPVLCNWAVADSAQWHLIYFYIF
jgi:hypothetical protein